MKRCILTARAAPRSCRNSSAIAMLRTTIDQTFGGPAMAVMRTVLGRLLSRRHRLAAGVASAALLATAAGQAAACEAATAFNAHLTRAPYLTDLVGTHVNVNWATDRSATTGSLHWGPVTGGTCSLTQHADAQRASITVGSVAEYQWKASLDAPEPGHVLLPPSAGGHRPARQPTPRRSYRPRRGRRPSPFSFDVFGDWGQVDASGNNADQANLVLPDRGERRPVRGHRRRQRIPERQPDQLRRPAAEGRRHQRDLRAELLDRGGQHDPAVHRASATTGSAAPRTPTSPPGPQDSAVVQLGRPLPERRLLLRQRHQLGQLRQRVVRVRRRPGPLLRPRLRLGRHERGHRRRRTPTTAAAHFAPGTPEYQWLLNDLQTHPCVLKFAFFALPAVLGQPETRASDTSLQGALKLEGLLGQNGVKIAFNGHAHIYERNNPERGRHAGHATSPAAAARRWNRSTRAHASTPTPSAGHRPSSRAPPAAAPRRRRRPARSSTS